MSDFKHSTRRALSGLAWMARHPVAVLRFGSAMQRGDGSSLAQQPDGDAATAARLKLGLRLMVEGGVREVSFSRDGLRWRTDLGDEIGHSLWRTGGYEGEEIAAVLRWMRAAGRTTGVVVDVGANIGTTSVPFARSGYRVLAIEPVPHTFDMLTTNIVTNGLDAQVILASCAVGTTATDVQMWTGFGSGQAEVAVEAQEPALERWGDKGSLVTVRSVPLRQLLAENGISPADVALVWSDVQGSETAVILSATEVWAAGVPLYLEVDPTSLELHGGLSSFVDAVGTCFTQYLSREDLIDQRAPQPVATFSDWVGSIDPSLYGDALLIP